MIPCPHRPPCPGCPHYGARGIAGSAAELLRQTAVAHGGTVDLLIEGAPTAYRVRARLAVRGRASSPKLGIFQEGTHRIADIPVCTIHHPAINHAARVLREVIRTTGVPPYADRPHVGLLRYVQIVVERTTGRVQIVLVTNDGSQRSIAVLTDALAARLGDRIQGLWWNGNTERTNSIFGPHWQLVRGDQAVHETIGGADVFFPPGAFGQSNLDLADRLVADVQSRVAGGDVVAELYCGVGAIGLGLVARSREVRFNEVSRHGLAGLELGLAALPDGVRAKAVVAGGDAISALEILRGASSVIVDPPRKGLEDEVVVRLRAELPAQLLYVSCDPESLWRDVAALTKGGVFRLRRLTPYALFPYTEHVETLAELTAA